MSAMNLMANLTERWLNSTMEDCIKLCYEADSNTLTRCCFDYYNGKPLVLALAMWNALLIPLSSKDAENLSRN